MTRTEYFTEYKKFIKTAIRLAEKARREGILSLENETEDLDNENFKQGLRFAVDGIIPDIIDEIYSNLMSFEKDEYTRQLLAIQKRTLLSIYKGENTRILYYVLSSYANLSPDEKNEIDYMILNDNYNDSDDLDLED